jgi:hypothetical protein
MNGKGIVVFLLGFIIILLAPLDVFAKNINTNKQIITSIQKDSLTTKNNVLDYEQSDDFSPGLLFFALIAFTFILASVGCGVMLTVLGLFIVFGLISFGVLSTSIIVGLNKKSFTKGFKTFLVLISTIGGLFFGGIFFGLLNIWLHWWTTKTAIIMGATCGLIGGLLLGLLAYYILQRLTNYFKERLNLISNA